MTNGRRSSMPNPFPTWIHGAPDCTRSTDPAIQVHHHDDDTVILRQSKCSDPGTRQVPWPSFEAPFLYLLFGRDRVLLVDTGASSSAERFPIGATVRGLIAQRPGAAALPLTVCHTHSHRDHTAGDGQFPPGTGATVVGYEPEDVAAFFGIDDWPDQFVTYELGGRTLDVFPIPGHEPAHIALYDRKTRLLLSGDSLYPGLLVVNDLTAYRASVARMAAFAARNPVEFVLGAHVEMRSTPGRWYGYPCLYQPDEHVLQLEDRHVVELHHAVDSLADHSRTNRHDDFIIQPAWLDFPPADP
jgi:glyoxylase-like metal-dependent hydrolase (beta-lactamase superfamily II)